MLLAAIAVACVLVIGFAAHRASLCNVRAVADILHARDARMLGSLLQAVLWMAALTGVLALVAGVMPQPVAVRIPLAWALAGGFVFGAGAAINGGCSLSTLHRLVDGNLGMLATLAGFLVGVGAWVWLMAASIPAGQATVPSVWLRLPGVAPWLLGALLAWVALRLVAFRGLARNSGRRGVAQHVLAPAYHVSVAAALLGTAGGLLFATQGAWSYTNFLRTEVFHGLGIAMAPSAWHGILVAGLLAGMLVSALERRALRWQLPQGPLAWARHAGGGVLMGAGAAMIPGGNDTLLLNGLANATTTALGAYLGMLAGIAVVLALLRRPRAPGAAPHRHRVNRP